MQTTFDTAPPPANPWQLGPTASKAARWIFGFGFFSVHLGIFLIGGLALLMINLYRSPADLWVGGPLIRWGVVVLIHLLGAIVTWAVTTAIDAAETTKRENAVYEPQRPVMPPPPIVVTVPAPVAPQPPRPRFQPALSTPVETIDVGDTRRFGFRGWKQEPELPPHRPSPPGWTVVRSDDPLPLAPEPARTSTPSQPAWSPSVSISTPNATAQKPIPSTPVPPTSSIDDELVAATEDDNRWTWVEAAAEAWLANRHEKSDPPARSNDDSSQARKHE